MRAWPAWFEAAARAAPSAHNTQPWWFAPRSDGSIEVRLDSGRTLPASDPTLRDIHLGLGAAAEALRLSALRESVFLIIDTSPGPADEVAILRPVAPGAAAPDRIASADDHHLAAQLERRRTGRGRHLPRPLPPGLVERLRAEGQRAGVRWEVVAAARPLRRLGRLTREATAALLADAAVHAELWSWLRLDPADPRYRRDGLTAECLELRGVALRVARAVLPPVTMSRLVAIRAHHLIALDAGLSVRRATSMCLLSLEHTPSTRAEVVEAGRVLLRLWLLAADAGVTAHPMSALLDCAQTRAPTVAVFQAGDAFPLAVYRMGECAGPPPLSPRLPVAERVVACPPDG